ncbi:MAG: hypothetical protein PHH08_00970 [Candidatus ainarchaeum sp.]|nr:hypothetical protein [Candidatus ainarchaeum sp.]
MPRKKSIVNIERLLRRYNQRRAVTGKEEFDSVVENHLRRKLFSGRRYLDASHSRRLKFLDEFELLQKSGIPHEQLQPIYGRQRKEQAMSLIQYQIKKGRAHTILQAITVLQRDISAIRKRNMALLFKFKRSLKPAKTGTNDTGNIATSGIQ